MLQETFSGVQVLSLNRCEKLCLFERRTFQKLVWYFAIPLEEISSATAGCSRDRTNGFMTIKPVGVNQTSPDAYQICFSRILNLTLDREFSFSELSYSVNSAIHDHRYWSKVNRLFKHVHSFRFSCDTVHMLRLIDCAPTLNPEP